MDNNAKTLKDFSVIMWGLAEEFGGTISKNSMRLKFEALKEYTLEDLRGAATRLMKYRQKSFPAVPTVAEIVDIIESKNTVSLSSRAEIQADLVLRHVANFNPYAEQVDFEDEITKALMSHRWSLKSLSENSLEKDNVWFRKEFIKAYNAYSEAEGKGHLLEINAPDELKQLANNVTKRI